ncbi:MAG TPA: cupin domain-containing protein [Stellaceae bacterium]|jgi:mannose-6-phosphate isomerase-like protein (cupin superfamily)|nr:cupin domain-containing protein [Stellaceae bacterium]
MKPAGKFIHRDQTAIAASDGNQIASLLSGAETAGRFAVREIVADPGAASAPALPSGDNRYVFIVAGAWQIDAGGERRTVRDGVSVFIPAGETYAARLIGTSPGKILEIAAPVARG